LAIDTTFNHFFSHRTVPLTDCFLFPLQEEVLKKEEEKSGPESEEEETTEEETDSEEEGDARLKPVFVR
jgi:hypothetical protein